MELIQLRYFISAAHFQNLSKASRVLHISQPALSKSISKLEAELDVQLFTRSGKRIILNNHGEQFLEHAINSLQELDNAVAAVNYQAPSPQLKLGMFHNSKQFLCCLGDFSKTNPDISFHVEQFETVANIVDTNEFDMLLYPQSPLSQKYKGNIIYTDPYFLAVHKSHQLARRESIRLHEIAAYKVMFIKNEKALYDLPYHMCVSLGIKIKDAAFTNNHDVQRWFVSNNHRIGFVPQSGSDAYAVDPDIVLLPIADEGLSQEIMIGFKRDKHLSPAGKEFAAFVRRYFGM